MKLPSRMIDLSSPLENETVYDPPFMRPKIAYRSNVETAPLMCELFPACASRTCRTAKPGRSKRLSSRRITARICMRRSISSHVVTAAEVEAELMRIGHELKPFEIVLVNTRAASCIGSDEYLTAGCGMGREATLYLTSRGVRVTGIDAWGWDAPFTHMRKRWLETHDPSIIWEGHKAGREIPYCHMEKLCDLERQDWWGAVPEASFKQRLGGRMRRRDFMTMAGGAAAWPFVARAQQQRKKARIGFLGGMLDNPMIVAAYSAFSDERGRFGWAEGQNLIVEYRYINDPNPAANRL
jgi:hypothetical protein